MWHQRQRMPGLKRSLDRAEYDATEERLEALFVAEKLGPDNLPLLEDHDVTPLLSSLLRSTAWGRVWPAEFAVKIVRRQVKANAENPCIVFQLIWPFGESTSGFDPLSPRLRDTAMTPSERLAWYANLFQSEFLAVHMPKDQLGAEAIAKFWVQVQAEQTAACTERQALTPDAQKTWDEVWCFLSVLSAYGQGGAAITPEQVAAVASFSKIRGAPFWRGAAKHLQRKWWQSSETECLRNQSKEALEQPRLERVRATLAKDDATSEELTGIWEEAKKHLGKWQKLRPKAWAETRSALLRSFRGAVDQLMAESAPAPTPSDVEVLAQRWSWLQQLSEEPEVTAQMTKLAAARSRAKLVHGLHLVREFVQSLGGGATVQPTIEQECAWKAAFDGCRGLTASGGDIPTILKAISGICALEAPSRDLVRLASDWLTLVPTDEGAEEQKAWARRFSKTAAAWNVIDKVGAMEGQVLDLTVTEARVALAEWSNHAADEGTTTVPPRVGEDAAVRAREGHTLLAETSARAVEEKKKALVDAVWQLEVVAGGSTEGGGSWKARLTDTSPWEDVAAAAGTHLLTEPKATQRLRAPHHAAARAKEKYEQAVADAAGDVDTTAITRAENAFELSLHTQAETKLVEILTRLPKDKVKAALQKQIAAMVAKEMDPDLLQAVLWQKAQDNLGA